MKYVLIFILFGYLFTGISFAQESNSAEIDIIVNNIQKRLNRISYREFPIRFEYDNTTQVMTFSYTKQTFVLNINDLDFIDISYAYEGPSLILPCKDGLECISFSYKEYEKLSYRKAHLFSYKRASIFTRINLKRIAYLIMELGYLEVGDYEFE